MSYLMSATSVATFAMSSLSVFTRSGERYRSEKEDRSPRPLRALLRQESATVEIRGRITVRPAKWFGGPSEATISANGLTFRLDSRGDRPLARRLASINGMEAVVQGQLFADDSSRSNASLVIRVNRARPTVGSCHSPEQESGPMNKPPLDATDFQIKDLKWKRRPLLIFAPREDSRPLGAQTGSLANQADSVRERDMTVIRVIGGDAAWLGETKLSETTAKSLRSLYDVPTGPFQVILVGKDGTVKLRSDEPVCPDRLFEFIDAMPMRQREMMRQKQFSLPDAAAQQQSQQ
ncbi:DUF4174 domain-containing protein [Roseiconus nitratireducens]|uniref:DUF4174 domain-containing protein n=2 Tax=Roseiconus nitratireducens TaxID=2605748 RepID=A0A5M6D5E6_9BACT|nr:DUF4174 domain-containing protein [Roseiconus nitratireducens]